MTDTGSMKGNGPDRAVLTAAGRHLQDEYQALFPVNRVAGTLKATDWSSAAANGATLGWAYPVSDTTAGTNTISKVTVVRVLRALRLASAAPIGVTNGLLAYGLNIDELHSLLAWKTDCFPETACRIGELYKIVSGAGDPDSALPWRTVTAVISAGPAGLTDLQALRWVQVFPLERPTRGPRVEIAMRFAVSNAAVLQEWVAAAGPDGWVWPAAGYTLNETRVLLALPKSHPDRPGPDQLAVMAALRQA